MEQGKSDGQAGSLVSVVIVNFNAGFVLIDVVHAVMASRVFAEVVVFDNGSTDDSIFKLHCQMPGNGPVRIVRSGSNLGFAKANNVALGMVEGELILLLNPDCVLSPGALEAVVRAMEANPDAGMAGALLRNEDGTEQAGCRRAVPTPWRTFVRILRLDRLFPNHPRFRCFHLNREPLPDAPIAVEAISGAFMLVRRDALKEVGLLDEGYFLHCEDLDWCMRFRQHGWKILFVPGAEAVHYKGACSAGRPIRVEWHKHRGMVRFYRKFFRRQYPAVLMWTICGGVWIRFAVLTARSFLSWASLTGRRCPAIDAPAPEMASGITPGFPHIRSGRNGKFSLKRHRANADTQSIPDYERRP